LSKKIDAVPVPIVTENHLTGLHLVKTLNRTCR